MSEEATCERCESYAQDVEPLTFIGYGDIKVCPSCARDWVKTAYGSRELLAYRKANAAQDLFSSTVSTTGKSPFGSEDGDLKAESDKYVEATLTCERGLGKLAANWFLIGKPQQTDDKRSWE